MSKQGASEKVWRSRLYGGNEQKRRVRAKEEIWAKLVSKLESSVDLNAFELVALESITCMIVLSRWKGSCKKWDDQLFLSVGVNSLSLGVLSSLWVPKELEK